MRKNTVLMKAGVVTLVFALMLAGVPVGADSALPSGYATIRDWDQAYEAFSFSLGDVTLEGGDFFIADRGEDSIIHMFDSPGIRDMGAVALDSIAEAPESGYQEVATPVEGHSYVMRSQGKYGKIHIEDIFRPPLRSVTEYEFEWVYQPNGTRSFGEGPPPSANHSPTASFSVTPGSPKTGDTVVFTSTSSDPDGDILTYSWYYDGEYMSSIGDSSHWLWQSAAPGEHTIKLVVDDGQGGNDEYSRQLRIEGEEPPPEEQSLIAQAFMTASISSGGHPGEEKTTFTCGDTVHVWAQTVPVSEQHSAEFRWKDPEGQLVDQVRGTFGQSGTSSAWNLPCELETNQDSPPGTWTVEIYIDEELDRTLSFTLSGTQTPAPTPGVKHLSCENKDNEEKGCCCFNEAHTYRFDPQYVSSVVAKVDTGRGFDCRSTVELQVDKGSGWETIKTVEAVSSSGGLELAPVEVNVPVNDTISGFRIYDGCVCCIDWSEITIYSAGTPPPPPPPTPTGTVLMAESRIVAPDGTVQVPISLEKAENIGSMNFVLTYDPDVLKVTRVDKGSLLSGIAFAPNYKEPPVIRFGFATKDGVSGSGSVAYVEFEAIGGEGSSSALTLSEILAKDISSQTLSLSTQNGKVTIQQKTLKGDYNGDGKVTELDALAALRMSVKLLVENLILDMDNDGKVTAEDARLILEQAVTAR